jgi:L-lactate dehydrogenase complex protein LldG
MSAREDILRRVRAACARMKAPPPVAPEPRQTAGNVVAEFSARAQRLASDVEGPVPRAQAPAIVARYLGAHGLPRVAVGWNELASLAWDAHGIAFAARRTEGEDAVGITGAFAGIAETGTLVLLSGAETPAAASLLPETHVALLPIARIVATLEDVWSQLRAGDGRLPRAVNLVSGPSRTADVEQTVTLGAHGPRRVLIVLTSD